MEKKSGIGKFLAGAAVGVGLGMLFAPKSGKENREDLKKCIDNLLEQVKNIDPKEVKDTITEKVNELKKELKELDKEKVLAIAKKKAKDIEKKAEELYKLAVEKGTPVLEKATADLKQATADTLKKIVNKLEAKETPKKLATAKSK